MSGCISCDDPGHMARYCTKTLNVPSAAQRKLEYLRSKAKNHAQQLLLDIFLQTTEIVEVLKDCPLENDGFLEQLNELMSSCIAPLNIETTKKKKER